MIAPFNSKIAPGISRNGLGVYIAQMIDSLAIETRFLSSMIRIGQFSSAGIRTTQTVWSIVCHYNDRAILAVYMLPFVYI